MAGGRLTFRFMKVIAKVPPPCLLTSVPRYPAFLRLRQRRVKMNRTGQSVVGESFLKDLGARSCFGIIPSGLKHIHIEREDSSCIGHQSPAQSYGHWSESGKLPCKRTNHVHPPPVLELPLHCQRGVFSGYRMCSVELLTSGWPIRSQRGQWLLSFV